MRPTLSLDICVAAFTTFEARVDIATKIALTCLAIPLMHIDRVGYLETEVTTAEKFTRAGHESLRHVPLVRGARDAAKRDYSAAQMSVVWPSVVSNVNTPASSIVK